MWLPSCLLRLDLCGTTKCGVRRRVARRQQELLNHAIEFRKLTGKKAELREEGRLKKQVSTLKPIGTDYLTYHTPFFSFIQNMFLL